MKTADFSPQMKYNVHLDAIIQKPTSLDVGYITNDIMHEKTGEGSYTTTGRDQINPYHGENRAYGRTKVLSFTRFPPDGFVRIVCLIDPSVALERYMAEEKPKEII